MSYVACEDELLSLTRDELGVVSDTTADKSYANAWLLKYSGNINPGFLIVPSMFTTLNFQYRLFADYSPAQGIHRALIGYTPDPCGTPFAYLQGVPHAHNGYYTGDSNGTGPSQLGYSYLLAETRVGTAGQAGWKTLNDEQEIPWVWSVIEFDSNGTPQNFKNSSTVSCPGGAVSVNYQIFPTYSVYKSSLGSPISTLKATIQQGANTAFGDLPPGQSLNQSCIR